MKWIGTKKVAFIPLRRTNAAPPDPLPSDWEGQITKRVELDASANGNDRSIRAWVRSVSSGVADIEPVVFPMRTISGQAIAVDALESELGATLRQQGFDGAAIVMLGGPGAGSNAGFWSRFAMAESNGVWMMELMHGLTGLKDFYHFNNDVDPADRAIGSFDEMSASAFTHLTAFSKAEIGWLDRSRIATFSSRRAVFDLQLIGSNGNLPEGRFSAVRIGSEVPYTMIEARKKSDAFDSGVDSEGVIVYRVQTKNPYVQLRPNGLKPLFLITKTALKVGESATIDNDVVVTVKESIDGGFKIQLDDPNRNVFDRTADLNLPLALSAPSACANGSAGSTTQILFRDGSGHVQEAWGISSGQIGAHDLTGDANGTPAKGTPQIFPGIGIGLAIFQGNDNKIRSLYHLETGVGEDNLSGGAGAPQSGGDPVGYYHQPSNTTHVYYRGSDGHLHELYWVGDQAVLYGGNLTGSINAPKAAGQPSAFVAGDQSNVVVYRSVQKLIQSVYWIGSGPSGIDNLSGAAGTPKAASDPIAYYTPHNDASQVVYLGTDGHLWELYWFGVDAVVGWNITAEAGAPTSITGPPAAYYSVGTNTKHVYYRTSNGRLHELWWVPGGSTPQHVDMTERYGLPLAADRPAAFTVEGQNTQHVVYRGTDKHIYEVIWT